MIAKTTEVRWLFWPFEDDEGGRGIFLNYTAIMDAVPFDDQIPSMVAMFADAGHYDRAVWFDCPKSDPPWGVGTVGDLRPDWLIVEPLPEPLLLSFSERERLVETLRADRIFARQVLSILRAASKGADDDD